jgi:CRP/FNR family transcriptional regulator
VCLININIFRYLIENNGYFAMKVFQMVNDSLLQFIEHNLYSLNYSNSHGRLASTLLYLSNYVFCSDHFDLLLSRKELSQYTNISRENVIKILYEFSHEGIISINNRNIQIILPELLRHYAEIS